jgi:hypothetical protein
MLKSIYSHGKAIAAGQVGICWDSCGIWLKPGPHGFPKKLTRTAKMVSKSGPLNFGLIILSTVTLLKLKPSYDISTITSAFKGTWSSISEGWYLYLWKQSVEANLQPWTQITWSGYHVSLKAGPMGPSAVLSSGLEAIAFAMTPGTLGQFKVHADAVGASDLVDRLMSLISYAGRPTTKITPVEPNLAKLAYLSDKAGKTRVVYIMNYWMQSLLKPLHDAMFEWLRRQPQDGTWDQRKQIDRIRSWTKEGKPLWSFDLTAATDRWPKCHQKVVVQRFAGDNWAELWDFCMSISPYSKPHNHMVSYSVGQPMGAYASWAALAMTHHMLIRSIADALESPMIAMQS